MQNWIRKGYISRYIFQYHEQVVCCFPSLGSSRCKTENAFIKVWWCISWPKISLPGKSLGEVHMNYCVRYVFAVVVKVVLCLSPTTQFPPSPVFSSSIQSTTEAARLSLSRKIWVPENLYYANYAYAIP